MAQIKVELPSGLCRLARVEREVAVEVWVTDGGAVTQRAVLDAVEARCPELVGTIRDQTTKIRRPFIRFFACEEDLSHTAPDEPLPEAVANGSQAYLIIGAIAGG
jgi:hypothetical protein